ncbi:unnamed protein product [Linum tenue]|uniref:Uncharacterized protein n=1 Tax=Linum tenue TaxID=586396 RepID=A0AAV0JK38_9ROSI|nr:unnamed protein product [Linum tenue]
MGKIRVDGFWVGFGFKPVHYSTGWVGFGFRMKLMLWSGE